MPLSGNPKKSKVTTKSTKAKSTKESKKKNQLLWLCAYMAATVLL